VTVLTEHPHTLFTPPDGAFALAPAEHRGVDRDGVRLLVASGAGIRHHLFHDLPVLLDAGDVLVVNDSATVAGQLDGRLAGRPVVVHVAAPLGDDQWVVELRTAPDAARAILDAEVGGVVEVGGVGLRLVAAYPHRSSPTGSGNRLWRVVARGDLAAVARLQGRPIAYGYLDRRYPLDDYQTVFATHPGSAEMASAARPFTDRLVSRLFSRGVVIAPITLHTGVSSQEAGEGPQPERFAVPAATARTVNAARRAGSRVVAVGTTATRALESAVGDDGELRAAHGWTERIVTPADPPKVVDGLVTGWHDPQASHLLLVEAVAGVELTQAAYDAAGREGYLWHEFGDSALLLPPRRR
jgi:S-adenosylmethionine:tRNA ribosyltransferase-isomerase